MNRVPEKLLLGALLLAVSACSGGSSGGGTTTTRAFTGAVTAAKVSGAAVQAYQINDDLTLTLIQSGSTDAQGNYTFDVVSDRAVLIVAGGGTYTDEATGTSLSLSAIPASLPTLDSARPGTLSAILGSGSPEGSTTLSLNPLTTIAAARVASLATSDATSLEASGVDAVNDTVASEFGLTQGGVAVDPRSLTPLDPSDPSEAAAIASAPQSPAALLGTIQAGLSQSAQDAGLSDPLDLIDALAQDFGDGALDGSSNGATISLGTTTLSSSAGTTEVAKGTVDFLEGTRNRSGTTSSDYTALLTAISTQDTSQPGVNTQPSALPLADQSATVGVTLNLTLSSVSAGEATQVVTVTASSSDTSVVPSVSVSGTGATRSLSLTPAAAGTSTITLTLQDDGGTASGGVDTATLQFSVTATLPTSAPPAPAANVAPVFSLSASALQVRIGDQLELPLEVQDPDGDLFSVTLLNPPPGATLAPILSASTATTRSLRWQVATHSVGRQRLLFRATDGTNVSIQTLDVDVLGETEQQHLQVADVTGDGLLDVIAVAPAADVGGVTNAGAVYVWAGTTAPVGSPTAVLNKPNPSAGDQLGQLSGFYSSSHEGAGVLVADVTGDGVLDVIAGSDQIDTSVANAGAFLVWAGGGTLTGAPAPLATLQIPTPSAGDQLGRAAGQGVQVGDVTGDGVLDLVIGAAYYQSTVSEAGGVFVWAGGGTLSGTPTPTATLLDPTPTAGATLSGGLGQGVLLGEVTGDAVLDVVAGAPKSDTSVTQAGEVFVWAGGGTLTATPNPTATLQRSAPNEFEYIGGNDGNGIGLALVDLTGEGQPDVVAISPYLDTSVNQAGGILVWAGGAGLSGTQTETAILQLANPTAFDRLTDLDSRTQSVRFGDVTGDGITDVIAGGFLVDVGWIADAGAVAVFAGGALSGTVTESVLLSAPSMVSSDNLGDGDRYQETLFLVDLSGDGVLDVVAVGPELTINGEADAGAVLVWEGGPSLLAATSPSATLQRETPLDSDYLGSFDNTQGGAIVFGDVTGDGITDVLIGCPEAQTTTLTALGEVLVFAGGATLTGVPTPTATLRKSQQSEFDKLGAINEGYGIKLGDVTGDGVLDVVVGGGEIDSQTTNDGGVLVWAGGPSLSGTPSALAELGLANPSSGDQLGSGGIYLGDVTGDGVFDIVAVTPRAVNGTGQSAGLLAVFNGGPLLGQFAFPSFVLQRANPGADRLGDAGTPLLADLDQDGVLDVLSVAWGYDGSASETGAVLFWRGGSGLSSSPTSILTDPNAAAGDRLGLEYQAP